MLKLHRCIPLLCMETTECSTLILILCTLRTLQVKNLALPCLLLLLNQPQSPAVISRYGCRKCSHRHPRSSRTSSSFAGLLAMQHNATVCLNKNTCPMHLASGSARRAAAALQPALSALVLTKGAPSTSWHPVPVLRKIAMETPAKLSERRLRKPTPPPVPLAPLAVLLGRM